MGLSARFSGFGEKSAAFLGGASGLTITKAFWDIINQLLWLGYANWDGASEDAFGDHGGSSHVDHA